MSKLGIPVSAVRDDPGNIATFSPQFATQVLRQLLIEGSTETCFQAMVRLPFLNFDFSQVVMQEKHLRGLLDQMVWTNQFLEDLCVATIGRYGGLHYLRRHYLHYLLEKVWGVIGREKIDVYWVRLIEFEITHKDPRRSWEVLQEANRGLFDGREKWFMNMGPEWLVSLIHNIHSLMQEKGQVPEMTEDTETPPTRVEYTIQEKASSTPDRLGRVRVARNYTQTGNAPGLHLAMKFQDQATMELSVSGRQVLAIAHYFSDMK